MKVLQVETLYSAGGIPRIVLSLMEALRENGDESRFVFGRQRIPVSEDVKPYVQAFGSKSSIYLHVAKSLLLDRSAFGSARATKQMIAYIQEFDPDVIHLHSLLGYYINVRILFEYLAKAGKPVVWTQHDCWAITGHCVHFVTADCDKWKTGCGHCPLKHTYPKSLFLDQSARNYREKKQLFTSVPNMMLVSPSEWLAGFIRASYLGKYPIRVIPNGIDLETFRPTESDLRERYGIGDRKVLLGVAGTWAPSKGLNYLTELIGKLDTSRYCLVVIGANDEQIRAMPEGVLAFRRTANPTELAQWYTVADVFVNPTLADNFPTVNLEALACGTPVVTFPTGGSVESVDETCGIVTKEQSSDALLEAIRQLETHPLSSDACLLRSKRYDRKERFREYVRLYHEMVETK